SGVAHPLRRRHRHGVRQQLGRVRLVRRGRDDLVRPGSPDRAGDRIRAGMTRLLVFVLAERVLTRTLRAASSTTQERARAVIAFRAAPTTTESSPESQESEPFRMIEPPSRMSGRALTTVKYVPCTLRSKTRWKCFSVTSPNLANSTTPAFAKRTSIALVSSMIRA